MGQLEKQLRCKSAYGDDVAVASLLMQGADVNATDSSGWAALHWACHNGSTAVVSVLLDNGADIRIKSYTGETALHKACYRGRSALVGVLLQRLGLREINSKDYAGRTPLHNACFYDQNEAAIALIRSGADVTISKDTGETPLEMATEAARLTLTSLHAEVNKVWFARRAFLIVLVGCGFVGRKGDECGDDSKLTSIERMRSDVFRNLHISIFSYL